MRTSTYMKTVTAIGMLGFLVALPAATCTPQQAQANTFTAEQDVCLVVDLATAVVPSGTPMTVATALEGLCKIAPAFTSAIVDIVNSFSAKMAEAQAAGQATFEFHGQTVQVTQAVKVQHQ